MIKVCKILINPNNEQKEILNQWIKAQTIVDKELKEICESKIEEQFVNEMYRVLYRFDGYERSKHNRSKEVKKALTERIKTYKEENNLDRELTDEEIKSLYLSKVESQLGEKENKNICDLLQIGETYDSIQ